MGDITGILSELGSAGTWFFGIFRDFITMITTNPLILFPVLFAICAGAIGLLIKVIRKFGLKGRR